MQQTKSSTLKWGWSARQKELFALFTRLGERLAGKLSLAQVAA